MVDSPISTLASDLQQMSMTSPARVARLHLLPTELLSEIADFLDKKAILSLTSVSKRFRYLFVDLALKEVRLQDSNLHIPKLLKSLLARPLTSIPDGRNSIKQSTIVIELPMPTHSAHAFSIEFTNSDTWLSALDYPSRTSLPHMSLPNDIVRAIHAMPELDDLALNLTNMQMAQMAAFGQLLAKEPKWQISLLRLHAAGPHHVATILAHADASKLIGVGVNMSYLQPHYGTMRELYPGLKRLAVCEPVYDNDLIPTPEAVEAYARDFKQLEWLTIFGHNAYADDPATAQVNLRLAIRGYISALNRMPNLKRFAFTALQDDVADYIFPHDTDAWESAEHHLRTRITKIGRHVPHLDEIFILMECPNVLHGTRNNDGHMVSRLEVLDQTPTGKYPLGLRD